MIIAIVTEKEGHRRDKKGDCVVFVYKDPIGLHRESKLKVIKNHCLIECQITHLYSILKKYLFFECNTQIPVWVI